MPRLTRIYTRTGDDGSTALGSGARISKDDLRVDTYGTVDELNAQLGAALCQGMPEPLAEPLSRIQNDLFHLGSDLCVTEAEKAARPMPRIEERHVVWLEAEIDLWNGKLPALDNFILPGGSPAAAQLHVARTVCRRAERRALEVTDGNPEVVRYLNRLSDLLFVLSRRINRVAGKEEPVWRGPSARD